MERKNLLFNIDSHIVMRVWKPGLSRFEQENCKCSLTSQGFRIFRPSGLTVDTNGHTMFGGLVLHPFELDSNILQEGHTYVIMLDVKGYTSNVPLCYWSNNVGWEAPELLPDLTGAITNNAIGREFSSINYVTYRYEFAVNDSLYKKCEKSYQNFIEGEYYLSYRDFFFGFTYESTGPQGTELYIRNIRMYDITKDEMIEEIAQRKMMAASNEEDLILGADRTLTNNKTATNASNNTKMDISKTGVMRLLALQENQAIRDDRKSAAVGDTGEVYAGQFIEF